MADVAKTCPFDPNVNTTMEAITIIKSETNYVTSQKVICKK